MGAVEQSYESVEAYLSTLDESYDSFTINQTTLAVSSARYERERERAIAGAVDLYTKVRNDDCEVLHLRKQDELVLPSTRTATTPLEHVATEMVEGRTGVTCQIDGVEHATILGIHDGGADHATIYRLLVVFEAQHTDGSPAENAVWQSKSEEPQLVLS